MKPLTPHQQQDFAERREQAWSQFDRAVAGLNRSGEQARRRSQRERAERKAEARPPVNTDAMMEAVCQDKVLARKLGRG